MNRKSESGQWPGPTHIDENIDRSDPIVTSGIYRPGGVPADKIVGYTYNTETLCPDCTVKAVSATEHVNLPVGISNEEWLDVVAVRLCINRYDEREFDSSDFPKVVFASEIEHLIETDNAYGREVERPECCDHCGEELV